jgi:hypothetical protein
MTACVRPMFDQSGRWRLEPFTVMGRRRDQSGVRTKQARAALSQAWIVRRTPLTRTVVLLCWTTHHARLDENLCSCCSGDFCSRAVHEERAESVW